MNRAWHAANKMPPRATEAERLAWHIAHARACTCRKPPERLAAAVAKALKTKPRARP